MCSGEVSVGSIIYVKNTLNGFKTIMRVGNIENEVAYCNGQAITNFGTGYLNTFELIPDYEGEFIKDVSLVDVEEFEVFQDFFSIS